MFEIDGRKFELTYTIGKVKAIESVMGGALLPVIVHGILMPPIETLQTILMYGMREIGGSDSMSVEEAEAVAEKVICAYGVVDPMKAAVEALRRDCGFLFLVNS